MGRAAKHHDQSGMHLAHGDILSVAAAGIARALGTVAERDETGTHGGSRWRLHLR